MAAGEAQVLLMTLAMALFHLGMSPELLHLNGMQLLLMLFITPVLFPQKQVRMSAVKGVYYASWLPRFMIINMFFNLRQ